MSDHWLRIFFWGVVVLLLSAVAWLHFAGRIDLVTADLGRHLVNGRLFFFEGRILSTNYYSYTCPDFPALCHHWGIGPFFYAIWKAWGFMGLSWAYTGILFATFALAVMTAWRASFIGMAVLAGALTLPLVGYRIEIRPEGISTLFLMIEYFLLFERRAGRLPAGILWVIPFIQLAWVNVHILFFTGLILTVFYVIDESIHRAGTGRRQLSLVLLAAMAASLMGPFTIMALSQPFTIFQGYGYELAENQTVFFMMKRFPGNPVFGCFLALFMLAVVLVFARMIREKTWRNAFPQALALMFFGMMAVKSVRAISMFGFIFIPIASESAWVLMNGLRAGRQAIVRRVAAGVSVVLVGLAAAVPYFYLSPLKKYASFIADGKYKNVLFYVLARPSLWGGLMPGVERSGEFFKAAGLKGPVFNNYDIGGYFIFTLFPQERPFVDNRPEAYPVSFFTGLYDPMQENDKTWAQAAHKYGFELIYFFRHDMTTWAQPFLIRRLNDPEWAPVFVDDYTIILARRNGANQAAIGRYELPHAMFKTTN